MNNETNMRVAEPSPVKRVANICGSMLGPSVVITTGPGCMERNQTTLK
jgi:hypothetical protein